MLTLIIIDIGLLSAELKITYLIENRSIWSLSKANRFYISIKSDQISFGWFLETG